MRRCLELASKGAGYVSPNPMVGAVLVYEDRIIGEGWHKKYGEAHAEVNCIASVQEEDLNLIAQSTLYVSLEPCAHFGKTPPCTDLIIQHKIPKVLIGCRDPFIEVNGKGIEKLKAAGVEVELAERVMGYACEKLNKRFFTFHTQKRPYIILKWAQTANGKIASLNPSEGGALDPDNSTNLYNKRILKSADSKNPSSEGREARLLISNEYSNKLVHQWRSEEAAILIGTNTALFDDPELTTRLWPGPSPIRLVTDSGMRLPKNLKIFNQQQATIIFNTQVHDIEENMTAALLKEKGGNWHYKMKGSLYAASQIANALYRLNILSVMVEGGAKLLQSFIDDGIWDEIRIIQNNILTAGDGLNAPQPENAILVKSEELFSDTIETYMHATEDY